MGGLEVKNKFLRCPICLEIKRLTIKPEHPDPKVKMNCRCSEKEVNLFEYLKELKKKDDFVIKCAKCQTEDPKEPNYCYQCKKIYCIKCANFHAQLSDLTSDGNEENKDDVNTLIAHKVIDIEKVDFYCVLHQNENFIGFCKKCLLNYCKKCEEENLHKDHEVKLYEPLLITKKKKELIKEGKKYCQSKMEYNHKVSKMIRKKIKNAENKKLIETLSKENEKINEKCLEFYEFLHDIYDKTKHKNYSIIFNVVNNTNFNVERLKFDKTKREEEDAITLIEYLKNDFILHTEQSLKKKWEKNDGKEGDDKKEEGKENVIKDSNETPNEQLFDEKYKDLVMEEEKKENEEKKEGEKEEKEEEKKEEKKEETKKEKKEREKREKEEKAKREKEEKEKEKKEKEERARKEKEDKEREKREEKEKKEKAKKEEKERKEKEKKEKEEKAKKEKEDKEKAKKEKKEKEEKAKKEKEEKDKKGKEKDKKPADDKKAADDKNKPKKLTLTGERAEFMQKMMGGGMMGGGMMGMGGRPAPKGASTYAPGEKPVQIEHTRNEGNTIDIINNIQVGQNSKKKPTKINFEDE